MREGTTGRADFVARHGLRGDADGDAVRDALDQTRRRGLDLVRLSFADQHGILRGKSIVADELDAAMRNGCAMTTTLLAKDTSHRTVYPVFTAGGGFDMPEMTGGGDFVMVPDARSFRVLPWAPGTGWMLCDAYFANGRPVPFDTRRILRGALDEIGALGFDYVTGLEVEFHLFRLEDPKLRPEDAGQPAAPPEVGLLAHGFQYLTELRMDELDPVLEFLRRDLAALGLPLRSIEVEFGPSQCEFTFKPGAGLESADTMVLFRSAVKQICRRRGYHATFMCRPGLANLFSSGWHLHQSLRERASGANAFTPAGDGDGSDDGGEALSPIGRRFAAGLVRHARAASVFTTPTINGYKRFKPYSLAPDRASWSIDNRGAMIRVIGGAGDPGARLENRVGEPAANPYLYLASQIFSGLDGIERALDLPPPTDSPYESDAEALPGSLMEALDALRADRRLATKFGATFIDYLLAIKQAEVARYLSEVTDWEQREYFELF